MHMSKRLFKQEPFLQLLARSTSKQRSELLKHAKREELKALFEICLNIIRGNFPIDDKHFKQLKKHRNVLRSLGDRKVTLKRKKQLVSQEGGAIRALVTTVGSLILPLLVKLIK